MSRISDILNNSSEILGWKAVRTTDQSFKSKVAAIAIAILKTIACPIFFAKAYFANKDITVVSQLSINNYPSRGEASSTTTPVDKPEERFVPKPKEINDIRMDFMRNLGFGDPKLIPTSPIPISVGEHNDDQKRLMRTESSAQFVNFERTETTSALTMLQKELRVSRKVFDYHSDQGTVPFASANLEAISSKNSQRSSSSSSNARASSFQLNLSNEQLEQFINGLGRGDSFYFEGDGIPVVLRQENELLVISVGEETSTLDIRTLMLTIQQPHLILDDPESPNVAGEPLDIDSKAQDEEEVRPSSRVTNKAFVETMKFALPMAIGAVIGALRYLKQQKD